MRYPRPILKRFGASSDDSDSPNSREGGLSRFNAGTNKVHFPNHPDALARTHLAHSPDDYDRSPIRIKPNICALPERGCPGRTYSENGMQMDVDVDGVKQSTGLRRGDHHHPCARVMGFLVDEDTRGKLEAVYDLLLVFILLSEMSRSPSLMQDSSDTSEESDNSFSTPFFNDPFVPPMPNNRRSSSPTSSTPASYFPYPSPRLSPKADAAQLAFLPYPHSTPTTSGSTAHPSFYSPETPIRNSRSIRRSSGSPTRQRRRSRSRVRGSPVRDRHGTGNKQNAHGCEADEGCLGGF
ncbi:hypothetical protein A7U60_g544 [Sanghuangporus baumii]|uniref:Uncharacterized protein n=1 Tax=Sanghuangporus baumii TaxID=108892 RepID=A0A9Q5I5A9_SANBA|nr:hypothetical protein A7U60_g544 [Sanghuangporus baumii]